MPATKAPPHRAVALQLQNVEQCLFVTDALAYGLTYKLQAERGPADPEPELVTEAAERLRLRSTKLSEADRQYLLASLDSMLGLARNKLTVEAEAGSKPRSFFARLLPFFAWLFR